MKKPILALITLSLFACGEVIDESIEDCNVYDASYSHTITYCGLDDEGSDRTIVNVEVLCDYRGVHERENCTTADLLPELTSDCGHFNQCWRD